MPSDESLDTLRYLLEASNLGLDDFFLAKMNDAANEEAELRDRLHRTVWALAWGLVAKPAREHRAEAAELFGMSMKHLEG